MQPSAPRPRLVTRVLLVVGALVTVVVGVELGARVLRLSVGYFSIPRPDNCLRRSSLLGMEFEPNCAAVWSEGLLSGDQPTSFTTNDRGLRDAPLAVDGTTRILAVGDSCTWGWQVPQNKAYPQALQSLIDRYIGAGKYRVINAGVPGYASVQGLRYLRERGLELQPSIVIIAYGFNDALSTGDLERALAAQDRFLTFVKVDDFLLERSIFWGWARTRLRDRGEAADPPDVRVPLDKYGQNIEAIAELVRERGAKPAILSFVKDDSPYGKANVEVGARSGVPVIVYHGPRIDIVHPTALGYSLLARQILERLQHEGYLPTVDAG
jgi:lysophospholipase L1-like esterase